MTHTGTQRPTSDPERSRRQFTTEQKVGLLQRHLVDEEPVSRPRALAARSGAHDNTVRLHGTIGYVTPADFLAGRGPAIWAARDAELEAASAPRRRGRGSGGTRTDRSAK